MNKEKSNIKEESKKSRCTRKSFPHRGQWMYSFVNIKMKQKNRRKRKKDLEGRHVIVRKNKSFVESKHIFWKQGTDAKSLFS